MRTAFIEQLIAEARSNPRVFLVVGDLGYYVVEPFAREFPERFLNAGVAEQNMTGVAAGLAAEGYHVFTYSIANFPTFRCAEQIRNDVAYHGLPVTVVAVGGGLAYGNLGYSHHAVQDFALMRSLPGMLVGAPGDPAETGACVRFLVQHPQPSYLRLGKTGEPRVHAGEPAVGPGRLVHAAGDPGAPDLILTTGAMLKTACEAQVGRDLSGWRVASLPLWSEACKPDLVNALRPCRRIVTVEEHLRAGGFGSYVAEACADGGCDVRIRSLALTGAACRGVGSQTMLQRAAGLRPESISAACTSFETMPTAASANS